MSRQNWRTAPIVFAVLNERFGQFDCDVAADDENHFCERWLVDRGCGVERELWGDCNFGNIPFGTAPPWIAAAAWCVDQGRESLLITHANMNSPWFHQALRYAELHCPSRRLNFWHPDEKAAGADRDSAIFHFGGAAGRVSTIEIPDHRAEVKRLIAEARGQESLLPKGMLL